MPLSKLTTLRSEVDRAFAGDEIMTVFEWATGLSAYRPTETASLARSLVERIRADKDQQSWVDAFLHEYQLSSDEGIILMSIAEALLRIPDRATQDRFLADKLGSAHWQNHWHHSDSLWVNLSTGALVLTGLFEQCVREDGLHKPPLFEQLLGRLGAPLIRSALKKAMQLLGAQFVMAETIDDALVASKQDREQRYSFDMLGEAAVTRHDAERYFQSYRDAIVRLSQSHPDETLFERPGISVKLSALCPRYEPLQYRRAVPELTENLLQLARLAKDGGITLTVDAEEAERLGMSLDIFAAVFDDKTLDDWPGLGIAVQAYQKRAVAVIHWLAELAKIKNRKIPVRLVKGAYWDSEIKRAQEQGLDNYPVYTRKCATDIAYLACAQRLLADPEAFYPQFATHNAHTIAAVLQMAGQRRDFEFQRLHGMGEALYRILPTLIERPVPCRVYAPIGRHHDLLPYLVRRLLENGANTSFINQIENPDIAADDIVEDPVAYWYRLEDVEKCGLPLPVDLFGNERRNSEGFNPADPEQLAELRHRLDEQAQTVSTACPLIDGETITGTFHTVVNPADHADTVGQTVYGDSSCAVAAIDSACRAFSNWRLSDAKTRARYLNNAADLFEIHRPELVSLCVREGGRTVKDALSEVREAVDFCRYYATQALRLFEAPTRLPGPSGEDNFLTYVGRGVFVCISPWNFPIAIFVGQIAAALAAGNTVIAKPAEATSLTASLCIRLLHQAGFPTSVLHFLPARGPEIGPALLGDSRIAGVAFTGSTTTAQTIHRQLAERTEIVTLIAETGGLNVLIADSTAHKEQLVLDALQSAFNSAGQRCSALRVLALPLETADPIIELLIGAMQEWVIGHPADYATDIGPVIDARAADKLHLHCQRMQQEAKMVFQMTLPDLSVHGSFFPPTLIEIDRLSQLKEEVFGPILHILRYRSDALDELVEAVNATGYGLTLGIHSRINDTVDRIRRHARVGNIYINRNLIGAVVGVQPFGGMGLSGTGPKAGGPNYLTRFAVEQTVTVNSSAVGGNARLLAQNLK